MSGANALLPLALVIVGGAAAAAYFLVAAALPQGSKQIAVSACALAPTIKGPFGVRFSAVVLKRNCDFLLIAILELFLI